MAEKEPTTKVLVVRTGTEYDHKQKPSHRFMYVTGDGDTDASLGKAVAFQVTKANRRVYGVGTVWKVDEGTNPDGTKFWYLGQARFLRMWGDEDKRLEWDAEDKAREAEHNAEVRGRKAGENSPVDEAIGPLRAMYKSMIGVHRAQFLAYVVREIVK